MATNNENGPLAGVPGQDLQDGWENGDNTPGEFARVKGVRGSVTKGQIALESSRRQIGDELPTVLPAGKRRRNFPRGGSHPLDASCGMRAIGDWGVRRALSKR